MGKRRFSRRNFLASGAAGAALTATTSLHSQEPYVGRTEGPVWERPPKQQGNNLNLILLMCDTFRADNLGCYGSEWIECPNLNKFAKDSIIFEDCYPEAMPTVAIRRTLWTGRRAFPFYYFAQLGDAVQAPGWHPLYFEDVTLGETLREAGYLNALVSDIAHLQRPGRNFHRGYDSFEWIRGQEFDSYGTVPHVLPDVSDIMPAEYVERVSTGRRLAQYKANRARWLKESDSLIEITARAATRWLEENHAQRPFFFHFEAFDPHEPWDPPRSFREKYMPNAKGHTWIQPPYANIELPKEAVDKLRANYAGNASCVDFWMGRILATIEKLGLFENSVVVFASDHGTLLGEQGQFVKGPERLRGQVTHIPLLVRIPGKQMAGKRVPGFVQVTDVMPTLLHLLGLKPPSRVTGRNVWPLVTGEEKSQREYLVQAFGWIAAVRSKQWNYSEVWNRHAFKGEYRPQLYDLARDPKELINVAGKFPDVVKQNSARLKEYIASGWDITGGSFGARPAYGRLESYNQSK